MTFDSLLTKRPYLTLLVIILIGSYLRFHGLTNQSLWSDELASWVHGNYATVDQVMDLAVKPDLHPPGYALIIFLVIKLLGDSEFILRLPSVIAGIATIPAIYLLAKKIFGVKEALIAAAFMAVTWAPLYYSQEARAYSLLLLTSLLTTYFGLHLVDELKRQAPIPLLSLLGYLLAAVSATYLHYYGFYLIGFQFLAGIVYLWPQIRALRKLAFIFTFIIVSHLPWLNILIYQFTHNRHMISWITPPSLSVFHEYGLFLFNQSDKVLILALLFIGFLLVTVLHRPSGSRPKSRFLLSIPELWLSLWLVVPLLFALIISYAITPSMAIRNFIISLPAAHLLLARAITQLPRLSKHSLLIGFLIAGVFSYQLFFRFAYYSKQGKEQFRHATAYIISQSSLYPLAPVIAYDWDQAHFDYYFDHQNSSIRVGLLAGETKDLPTLDQYLNFYRPHAFWYLSAHRRPQPEFLTYLTTHYRQQQFKPFIGANVWLFTTSY